MPNPPPADKIPGEIKRRPAKGKKSDRPLERIRKGQPPLDESEAIARQNAQRGNQH